MEEKNEISMYEIHNTNEDVSFCEQVEGNTLSPKIDGIVRKVCKTSEVSYLELVQASSTVYNTEGRISSEGLNTLYDGIRYLQSKGSDLDC